MLFSTKNVDGEWYHGPPSNRNHMGLCYAMTQVWDVANIELTTSKTEGRCGAGRVKQRFFSLFRRVRTSKKKCKPLLASTLLLLHTIITNNCNTVGIIVHSQCHKEYWFFLVVSYSLSFKIVYTFMVRI